MIYSWRKRLRHTGRKANDVNMLEVSLDYEDSCRLEDKVETVFMESSF